jgi:transcriptional regulator with XRE-family HTH domain
VHNEQLVENIKKLAKEKNTSVKSVLETCNINRNFMYDIKKGSTPSSEVLLKLANYFNVSVDYLLGLTDEKNKSISDSEPNNIILRLFNTLDEKQQEQAIDYIKYLISQKEK